MQRYDRLIESGRTALGSGDVEGARQAFEQAASIRRAEPMIQALLADVCLQQGDKVEARRVLDHLLLLCPDNVQVIGKLMKVELELGNPKRVAELKSAIWAVLRRRLSRALTSLACAPWHMLQAIAGRLTGKWPDVTTGFLCVRGRSALKNRSLSEAATLFERARLRAPDHPRMLYQVGRFCIDNGNPEAALIHLRAARAKLPGDLTIDLALIEALARSHRVIEAERELHALPEEARQSKAARWPRAWLLRAKGEVKEARDLFAELLDGTANTGHIAHIVALLDASSGGAEQARDGFAAAARLAPRMGQVYWSATLSRCIEKGDDLFEGADALRQDVQAPQLDRALAEMAVGRALIRAGETELGFAHIERGNRMTPMAYDPEESTAGIDALCETFSEQLFAKADPPARGEGRIFIVGLPRSGSTLVEQILASHPLAHGIGESPVFVELACNLREKEDHRDIVEACRWEQLNPLADDYLTATAAPEGSSHVVDKNLYNLFHLGLIALVFPKAKIVHCRRDIMDNGFSLYSHWFSASYPYATDLRNIGHHYGEYCRLMDHWRRVLPNPIFDLDHERLIQDQETETRRLLDFVDLPFDQACLDFQNNKRAVTTSSLAQIRQGINAGSVGGWRRFEQQLEPLRLIVDEVAADRPSRRMHDSEKALPTAV
ncbi:MAG: sulfotransferase [Alphaproteobacteria bacterium]|nr:sulfotransferase [Alphaproteobacteria bacterium]